MNSNPSHSPLKTVVLLKSSPDSINCLNQVQKLVVSRNDMGWWPFGKSKPSNRIIEPITKDGRTWLLELRDMCERNFDNPEEAKRRIRQMQVEWQECLENGSLSSVNKEALDSRAIRLLSSTDSEWLNWLDDLEFWKTGWKPVQDSTDKD